MATSCNIIIVDDHLGLLNGRNAHQEAEFINAQLTNLEHTTILSLFTYVPEGDCIIGEIKYYPGPEHREIFSYDFVYYRANGDGPLILYK